MRIKESVNCLSVASAVPILVFLRPYPNRLDKRRVADVSKIKTLFRFCCISAAEERHCWFVGDVSDRKRLKWRCWSFSWQIGLSG